MRSTSSDRSKELLFASLVLISISLLNLNITLYRLGTLNRNKPNQRDYSKPSPSQLIIPSNVLNYFVAYLIELAFSHQPSYQLVALQNSDSFEVDLLATHNSYMNLDHYHCKLV